MSKVLDTLMPSSSMCRKSFPKVAQAQKVYHNGEGTCWIQMEIDLEYFGADC